MASTDPKDPAPLNRDGWRDEVADEVAEDDADVGASPFVYLLPFWEFPPRISTISSASLDMLDFPSSMLLMFCAPAGVLTLTKALRKPGSSECSAGSTSTSTSSSQKTSIKRMDSFDVLRGKRLMRTEVVEGAALLKGVPTAKDG